MRLRGSPHLSAVHHIDDDVGLLVKEPVVQRREVRRVISETAVRLDYSKWDGETRSKDDLTALVQLHEAWEKGRQWEGRKGGLVWETRGGDGGSEQREKQKRRRWKRDLVELKQRAGGN